MNRFTYILLLFTTLFAFSCSDSTDEVVSRDEFIDNTPQTASDTQIYDYQINRDVILNSMIDFNQTDNRYSIGMKEQDMLEMGFTHGDYLMLKEKVNQLNHLLPLFNQ